MELPGLRFLRREGSGGLANEVGRWPTFYLVIEMRQDFQMLRRIVAATVERAGIDAENASHAAHHFGALPFGQKKRKH